MRKAGHCGEHSSCILCLLSCMPPSSSRPSLVLPLHHSQVALAQPAALSGCRPAWGDAVHRRPPASHLTSADWHAAGFSSYVCRARASKVYAMKQRIDIHGADKHTDKHTDSVSPRIQAREGVRQPVSPGSYSDLATVLTHYIANQTLLPQVSIISSKHSWILPRNCSMSFLSAVHSRGDCGGGLLLCTLTSPHWSTCRSQSTHSLFM